ncbi:glycoside hydrolase family 9 protein [Asticcacaulis solisilvae]|uniref:glycoside hydrolase family 9 protein n=1 Tax=Asticcacaulis solisilvae TaxID=1217274 RepID=UPI003FD8814F
MKLRAIAACVSAVALMAGQAFAAPLHLNDKGYYEARGVNVLVFSNWYDGLFSDSKISGVELIHHGIRTATNGDVRMSSTPGQWDLIGQLVDRKVDPKTGVIDVTLKYAEFDFTYHVRSEPHGDGVTVSVVLDKPLPEALAGRAGFNLEFVPSAYFHKSYLADGKAGEFPRYPSSPMALEPEARFAPQTGPQTRTLPLASAKTFVLAPEDEMRRVTVTDTDGGDIGLYDGRNQAQNGWYVLRTLLPANKTGTVVSWNVTANAVPNWVRAPNIGHSQLGYAPAQQKVAVVELDPNDMPAKTARILQIQADGSATVALTAQAKPWGKYLRYHYLTVDFSSVTKPGLYEIEYNGQKTATFRIAADIYADAWHPTNDVYFPVAMDHMYVKEGYRVWHGDSHKDDALQAPVNEEHLDLYGSGPTTDTRFKPFEHIPGLNVGGWFDAGDFDIRTQSQYAVVQQLVDAYEKFHLDRDDTSIDEAHRLVTLHTPDGQPDVVQQIAHGTIQLVAQFHAVGHAISGIVEPDLTQYPHLGDAVTKTDGLIYDPTLGPFEEKDGRSGRRDDRLAYTNKSSALNYGSIAALAGASRVLRGHDDALADESLAIAKRVWAEEHSHAPDLFRHGNVTGGDLVTEELSAAVALLITTKDPQYAARIDALWPEASKKFALNAQLIARAIPYMPAAFKARVRPAVVAYKTEADALAAKNPYGVPITEGGWAGNGAVMNYALTAAALHETYPDIVSSDAVFRGIDYLMGTHPGHNLSFVSGVGTQSKEVAYGNNRADFTFIAGGVVPGALIIKPDYPENREDYPFFWGENEYVIPEGSLFIELVNTANALSK